MLFRSVSQSRYIGPLFGNFKFQADVFTCPIRLYNAMLHNNTLNIGLDMSKVKLPKAEFYVRNKGDKEGKASLAEYLGVRVEPWYTTSEIQEYNIVPFLGYYDIFKNYYANKQEERFYIMGGSTIQNATTIVSTDFIGNIVLYNNDTLKCTSPSTVTITGTDVELEKIEKIKYILDSNPIYIYLRDGSGRYLWETVSEEKNQVVIKTRVGIYYRTSRVLQGNTGQSITLKGTAEDIEQGTVTDA